MAAALSASLEAYALKLFFPIPSALKLAPGLLDHSSNISHGTQTEAAQLKTTYEQTMAMTNVYGLSVTLSPGTLVDYDGTAERFIAELHISLMSGEVDLHAANLWSHPRMVDGNRAWSAGALRAQEWTRAAHVVHSLAQGPTVGEICSWEDLDVRYLDSDHLVLTGLDHLLSGGRGAGGKTRPEAEELKTVCFVGLLSCLAATPEVLQISPLHRPKILNAVASSVVQAATTDTTERPLTDAGLDGTGEVIQIVDTGVDETSCFFIDEDGQEVEHGYYFDEVGFVGFGGSSISSGYSYSSSSSTTATLFSGGYFPFDSSRRKIVQYIRLVKPESSSQSDTFYTSEGAGPYSWYSASRFGEDEKDGHGTHVAGSAAGATLNNPAVAASCSGTDELGCIGGCLNTSFVDSAVGDAVVDFNTWCPQFDCDGYGADYEPCLDEDVAATLTENGGLAQGAKLAVFDVDGAGAVVWPPYVGNGIWESTDGTGCMLHSISIGSDTYCTIDAESVLYDQYMYENPEHLLLFAAGNEGDYKYDSSRDGVCTVGTPALAKNVLAIGASSSGITRLTDSDLNGDLYDGSVDLADIDTVSYFSSYGPTRDDRIKPELVAPGDQVLSAGSDGTDGSSCRLVASSGTSMSTPIVAGAAALVRQYFKSNYFYAADVDAKGLCTDSSTNSTSAVFTCEAFSPYAVTVKAILINSANLMGGSPEPDGFRGFGRVHLEAGLPLDGAGDTALFVADAANTSIAENVVDEYSFVLNSNTGLEFRAILAWMDPAASVVSSVQLVHDLDLYVVSPSGTVYQMWRSGVDDRNVVERVVVPADVIDSDNDGSWVVQVSSKSLTTTSQSYSLVVTGAIGTSSVATSAAVPTVSVGGTFSVFMSATAMVAAFVGVG